MVVLPEYNTVILVLLSRNCCLSRCKACNWNSERRTGNIVETSTLAECNCLWISTMLTTDTHLHIWSHTASKTNCHLQKLTYSIEVDCCERIVVVELLIAVAYIVCKEGSRVVTGEMLALEIVDTWLNTEFSHAERHQRRIDKVMALENE